MRSVALFYLFSTLFSTLNALAVIQRSGRYLYNTSDSSRFYIKGVAYQPQGARMTILFKEIINLYKGTVGTDAADPFPEPTE